MVGLILAILVVFGTVYLGVKHLNVERPDASEFLKKVLSIGTILLIASFILTPSSLFAASEGRNVNGNAMIGVALSTGLAALGAGIAVGLTGAAAIGAVSEDPRMLGRSLIFVGLAEGIAIYGLVISIMIFGRV